MYIIVYRYRTDITNPVENMIRLDPSQLSSAWTRPTFHRQEIHSVVVLLGLSFFGFVWGLTGAGEDGYQQDLPEMVNVSIAIERSTIFI